MPTCTATINLPHPSGQAVSATFDCAFTRQDLYSWDLQSWDPPRIDDWPASGDLISDDELGNWCEFLVRNSPKLLADLHEACVEKADSGEAYAGDPYDNT